MAVPIKIKTVTIITEGVFDAKVLKKLLKSNQATLQIDILEARGYSSALSKVRSLITLTDSHIILILDTDTTNALEIKQKEDFVKSYINTTTNRNTFKVFWAIPEFEIVFLNNKKFLSRLTTKRLGKDLLEIGKQTPKKVLETFSNKKRDEFIEILNNKEVRDEFFKDGLIKEISDYIKELQEAD